jgi:signal transduction histidine kinase
MASDPIFARCDAEGLLVEASEPVARLQAACGGTIPGVLAIPALAELLAQARAFGLKLARPVQAQDGADEIRAWAEIEPHAEGGADRGWRIVFRHWQASPLPPEEPGLEARLRAEIDRALAELTARLDAGQGVLTVETDAADLVALAAAMRGGIGRPWTDFVTILGDSHRQPLHWRLLDGCAVQVDGSVRAWRAGLVPFGPRGEDPAGFELTLAADSPLGDAAIAVPEALAPEERLVGRELAPAIRQPIARIVANAETIRLQLAGPLDQAYSAYAADIAHAGSHLLGLIEDLSDLEVIEAPDFTAARDEIDLADVARRACGILAVRARQKQIALAAPAENATLPARAEFRRALQVMLNLIGNAIHYSPDNSTVSLLLAGDGARSRLTVSDEGPGMNAEQQARIFDKFERLGRSGDGGSGLGLYISRRLARAMGGDLTVDSAEGQGARFTLDVPAE